MSSVKPGTWPSIGGGDLDGNRLKIISQNPITGEERVISEMELLKFIGSKVKLTPIGYTPAPTGNLTDRNGFVIDPANDVFYIDIGGNSIKFDRGDQYYFHQQIGNASNWIITHNLGRMPSIQTFDSDDIQVMGTVTHDNINQVTIQFTVPISGFAIMT